MVLRSYNETIQLSNCQYKKALGKELDTSEIDDICHGNLLSLKADIYGKETSWRPLREELDHLNKVHCEVNK